MRHLLDLLWNKKSFGHFVALQNWICPSAQTQRVVHILADLIAEMVKAFALLLEMRATQVDSRQHKNSKRWFFPVYQTPGTAYFLLDSVFHTRSRSIRDSQSQ